MRNNYSIQLKEIIEYSYEEAGRLQNNHFGPEHLFLGILREGTSKATQILADFHIDLKKVKRKIELAIKLIYAEAADSAPQKDIVVTEAAERVLRMSMLESRIFKSKQTEAEHLLLAILKEGSNTVAEEMSLLNIEYEMIYNKLAEGTKTPPIMLEDELDNAMLITNRYIDDDEEDDEDEDGLFSPQPPQDSSKESVQTNTHKETSTKSTTDTPVLDNFGVDMTRAALENKFDPVIGRDMEIERLAQILSRRKKNNPVLIGEPGVGKSAIVEGLAMRIVQRKVARILFDKRVISLDMASVVAGTKYRGQFEERIKAILNELANNPQIILFIDEIHTIIGAGAAAGSMDAANMLKPALARGEIQCIGATTLDEYRKTIEKDGALERRFQKIIIEPTSVEETIQILHNIKDRYEEHHNVSYTDEAIKACVTLTERYVSDRKFPDKAIDALDEAGSRVHIANVVIPKDIEVLEIQVEIATQDKLSAVKSQNFELAASFRDKERILLEQLTAAKIQWESSLKINRETVDEDKVAEVVAMMTGVPVQRIAQAENAKLLEMRGILKQNIVGQDDAIEKIVKAIQRNRVGLKDPNKPIGTFMFLGPTGVGKTHLAKKLAEFLFNSSDAIIRIDMSEYMEKINVSRLVGAPPGYVGYEEGGILTEKVRRKPYSVVLFDEIEKAHPDVFNLLLQVLDEGHLTDSLGRKIDFKNTILIMTSNVGTRQLKDFGQGVGFNKPKSTSEDKEFSRGVIQKALNKAFSPEFINRIDDIVMFDQLNKATILNIIDIELNGFYKRIERLGYKLNVSDEAKTYIADQGYDIQFGARPLKRAIQKYIEDEMAELILSNTLTADDVIHINYDSEAKKIVSHVQLASEL